ncbi:hypothetical protein [Methylophilus sp. Leaf408]|uniref:hypothetical protein n=1 Tax=Methylophilus sp. Leaf408 TaxID=2876561 RepID=UPI001E4B523E|nr:hypothetical protein [Methylophilus sp. Leaf408]
MISTRSLITYLSLSLLTLTMLNACALAQRRYVPPTSGDLAQFRAISTSGLPFSGPIATFSDAKICKGRYFIQSPAEIITSPTNIAAGTPFSVALHQPLGGSFSYGFSYCIPVITFTPVAGRLYTATVGIEKDSCSIQLDVADSLIDKNRSPEPFIKKEFSNGLDENSSFCNSIE